MFRRQLVQQIVAFSEETVRSRVIRNNYEIGNRVYCVYNLSFRMTLGPRNGVHRLSRRTRVFIYIKIDIVSVYNDTTLFVSLYRPSRPTVRV